MENLPKSMECPGKKTLDNIVHYAFQGHILEVAEDHAWVSSDMVRGERPRWPCEIVFWPANFNTFVFPFSVQYTLTVAL